MQENLPLWNKIRSFSIDDGTAVVPFSAKLAASQGWSVEFTQRAIEEYKRFILLCCISEKGASPSQTVDEVWHLHLTYTQSYWTDFCRNTLGRDIHHHPSAGGDQENHRHREWYKETLQLYRTVFGSDPPADIWPAPLSERQIPSSQGPGLSSEWPVPEDPHLKFDLVTIAALAGLLITPFLLTGNLYETLSPFDLSGPHFLWFFLLYGVAVTIAHFIYRGEVRKKIMQLVEVHFPDDVTTFQMAAFLYGKHRALQAGIVDLINRDLLEVTDERSFRVKKTFYRADRQEANPLMAAYDDMPDGSVHTYKEMITSWYDRTNFSHPGLEALYTFARRRESFPRLYAFHTVFFGVFIARCIQGLIHHRSIAYLLIEAFVFYVIFLLVGRQFSKRTVVHRKMYALFKQHRVIPAGFDDLVLKQFALKGFPAINGSMEGLLLAGIFAAYTPRSLQDTGVEWNKAGNWNNGGKDGGSSCGGGGSSCGGGGSSCGGGSCGGGGGCGGCGGGH